MQKLKRAHLLHLETPELSEEHRQHELLHRKTAMQLLNAIAQCSCCSAPVSEAANYFTSDHHETCNRFSFRHLGRGT